MTLPIAWSGPTLPLVARQLALAVRTGAQERTRFRAALHGKTPLSPEQAARLLAEAWHEVLGERPSRRALSLLWAQWALETGRGGQMHGNNFGGIKGVAPGGGSALLLTREGQQPQQRLILSRFRVYATAEAGARDYVRTLADSYPEALEAARTGSPRRFVAALAQRRYFTASAQSYLEAVRSLAREFCRARPGPDAGGPALAALPPVALPRDKRCF